MRMMAFAVTLRPSIPPCSLSGHADGNKYGGEVMMSVHAAFLYILAQGQA